jgi:hypothetical protein
LLAGAVVLILCLHFGHVSGLTTGLQNSLTEARAAASQRPASGKVVLLAIDKQSIDHIGQWPWPRSVHARIIDRLTEAGVSEMALDIDFSTASNPQDDKALAAALERAGGAVILAAFRQPESADAKPENCRPTCPSAACCNTPGPVRSTCWPTKMVWSGASLMARPSAVSSCPPFRPCWPPHRVRKRRHSDRLLHFISRSACHLGQITARGHRSCWYAERQEGDCRRHRHGTERLHGRAGAWHRHRFGVADARCQKPCCNIAFLFPLESWSLVPCLWRCCSCSPSCPSGYACHGF